VVALAVALPNGIEPEQLRAAAVVVIVILAIIAFVVLRVVQKIVTKLVLLVALAGGGFFLYTQRDDLDECQQRVRGQLVVADEERCRCEFVGVEVSVPECRALLPDTDE
jgi:hypothetical protein